jgi:hypothetical protein
MFMYLLENEIMGVIMTINYLSKISYVVIFQSVWPKIINDDIIDQ